MAQVQIFHWENSHHMNYWYNPLLRKKLTDTGRSNVLAIWEGMVMTTVLLCNETTPSGVSYVKLYPPLSSLLILKSFQDNFTLLPNLSIGTQVTRVINHINSGKSTRTLAYGYRVQTTLQKLHLATWWVPYGKIQQFDPSVLADAYMIIEIGETRHVLGKKIQNLQSKYIITDLEVALEIALTLVLLWKCHQ